MSMVPTPTPVFYEANGAPLQNGYIYIGTADMDPIANPIQVYWDEALTITATQPIRTLGGYPSYQGKPARLFVAAGSYSITVKNKSLITIISQATANWSFITVSDLASTASGKGAWLVKWISALTGAVARWVGDRLRDTVHVTDFGAVGDGVTDDSAAVTSAIATGREVYFPAGTFNITPRTFSDMLSAKIRGAGRDVTKIVLTSTGTGLTFSNCQWLQISDMSIQATGTAQTLANAIGVQLDTGSSNCVIERVNFYGFSLDGLRMVGTSGSPLSGNVVRNCYFLGCGQYNIYSDGNS